MDGRFRFEFVLASVSFQRQVEHRIAGSPYLWMSNLRKKTEEHSEEASSLIRQLLTPDLCERLKSAAEVKVLMKPSFAKNWRCKGAKWTVEQCGTWLLDVMMRWRKVGVEDLDLCLLQSEKPGFCVEKISR